MSWKGSHKPAEEQHEVDAPKKLAQETRVIIIYSIYKDFLN